MIARGLSITGVALLALTLAACGEKPQRMDVGAKKADAEPWTVSDAANPVFKAGGWKAGDKTSWEEELRKRNQAQNDYAR